MTRANISNGSGVIMLTQTDTTKNNTTLTVWATKMVLICLCS